MKADYEFEASRKFYELLKVIADSSRDTGLGVLLPVSINIQVVAGTDDSVNCDCTELDKALPLTRDILSGMSIGNDPNKGITCGGTSE